MKQVKRFRRTNWQLQSSHGEVKCSIGSTVSNIVITVDGARGVQEISGEILYKVCDCLTTLLYT